MATATNWSTRAAALLLSLAIVALAWPRARAELTALPGTAGALASAGAVHASPRFERRLARLYLQAGDAASAVAAAERALAAQPSDVFARLWLLNGLLRSEGVSDRVVTEFDAAIAAAPYVRSAMLPRLDMGLLLWPKLDEAARARMAEQIRLLAAAGQWRIVDMARRRHAAGVLRAALAGTPQRQSFDNRYGFAAGR